MTLLFIASAAAVLVQGFTHLVIHHGQAPVTGAEGSLLTAVILSFPVAMALATGTEAPSSAIAQLGQLDPDGRRRFARGTLALTRAIVAALTIGLAGLAVRLHIGIPGDDSTQIAGIAHAAADGPLYAIFQGAAGRGISRGNPRGRR